MDEKKGTVEFSKFMALVGMIAGALIAVVVPLATLNTLQRVSFHSISPNSSPDAGQLFSPWFYLTVIVLSLLVGGLVTLVSAFFGIVIPRRAVSGKGVGMEVHFERGKPKNEAPASASRDERKAL